MAEMTYDYDFLVLGAGSGGLAASKRAASYGARTAIVEKSRVGGTCVIRGCIPKKLMYYAASFAKHRGLASYYGWETADSAHSWEQLTARRDAAVERLEGIHETNLDKAGVTLLRGEASFVDSHTIDIDGKPVTAEHILIATGGRPRLPDIPGIELSLSSDAFWHLETMPSSAIIVGGGYIGVEFAGILQGLGCQATLVTRSTLLGEFDHEIGERLHEEMTRQGIRVILGARIEEIEKKGNGVCIHYDDGSPVHDAEAETAVLFAIGRIPNTDTIGLEKIGVATGERGEVVVDERHVTSVPNVYAIGDVLDKVNLTPVAIKAGRSLADWLFKGKDNPISYEQIPTAVFSNPPVGTVGLTEEQAVEKYGEAEISVFRSSFVPLSYSFAPPEKKHRTFMKMIVHTESDRVLGLHMLGDDAPEIIQGFAVALQTGATKAEFDRTVAVHPSAAEEFVLMG
ncbi:MAG: glutathione-disulfide reductase [Myxococcales bacterium]|nr:glutathione-disulfide reductase [Myxococcales bacterium]